MIRGKWKTIIVYQLQFGNTSLSKLRRDIVGVSEKMLVQHLNELQSIGMVDRVNFPGYPLRVEYFLTERGKKVSRAVNIMQEVGIEYMAKHNIPYHTKDLNTPFDRDVAESFEAPNRLIIEAGEEIVLL